MAQSTASEEIRRLAAEIGLTQLDESQLQALARATHAAKVRTAKLRTQDLSYADEPAHVFALPEENLR